MSKLNPISAKSPNPSPAVFAKERLAGGSGALAAAQTPEHLLRRAVLACLLWEDTFYASGDTGVKNISQLIPEVEPSKVAQIAIEARKFQKLRHVPLYMAVEMLKHDTHRIYVADVLKEVITRPDMITDLLAIYWKEGKKPLPAQFKKGLQSVFNIFTEFQFAKYDRSAQIKLRDAMFLVHPKPESDVQASTFKKLANRTLATPDTWEVEISKSQDKKASWTRLITENKLFALAFLRNLRNMVQAGVDHNVIREGMRRVPGQMLMPMNFLMAQRHAPELTDVIEEFMVRTYKDLPQLPGRSLFVIDVSGSMGGITGGRLTAAAAMALLAINQCESVDIFCTSGNDGTRIHQTEKIMYPSTGFKLIDQIGKMSLKLGFGGIFTRQCLEYMKGEIDYTPDRIMIFSDSQDCDLPDKIVPKPFGRNNYIVDVSSNAHGVNYKGVWTAEITGMSDHFLNYIACLEGLSNQFEEEN